MKDAVRFTKWCVVTGAPCSGKTTLVQALQDRGYRTIPEVAREIIREEIACGKSLRQITADAAQFERKILDRKHAIENGLPGNQVIIFDRGLPDSMAYFEMAGLSTDLPYQLSRRVRYQKVFFLDPLPFTADGERLEDAVQAARLEELIWTAYRDLDYAIITVPAIAVTRRVRLVLSHLL